MGSKNNADRTIIPTDSVVKAPKNEKRAETGARCTVTSGKKAGAAFRTSHDIVTEYAEPTTNYSVTKRSSGAETAAADAAAADAAAADAITNASVAVKEKVANDEPEAYVCEPSRLTDIWAFEDEHFPHQTARKSTIPRPKQLATKCHRMALPPQEGNLAGVLRCSKSVAFPVGPDTKVLEGKSDPHESPYKRCRIGSHATSETSTIVQTHEAPTEPGTPDSEWADRMYARFLESEGEREGHEDDSACLHNCEVEKHERNQDSAMVRVRVVGDYAATWLHTNHSGE